MVMVNKHIYLIMSLFLSKSKEEQILRFCFFILMKSKMKKKVVEVLNFSLSGFCFLHHYRLEAKHLVILILLKWIGEFNLFT